MTHPVMTAYLLALSSHTGPGPAPLPMADFAAMLGLDGLGLLLSPTGGPAQLVQSHGEHTDLLEDLQQVQGQGPSLDAARFGSLLLIPDIAECSSEQWPGLPAAVQALGIRAVFAFPLRIGVIGLGALSGYRTRPGPMSSEQLADALGLAEILAQLTNATATHTDLAPTALLDEPGLHFAEVHQATGMLAAQLHSDCDNALILLRGHAFSHDQSLLSIARDVLAQRLHLDDNDNDNDNDTPQP
ncbi:ANTAR domain-containing protein [Streptomyces flavofungini]|uniref:ANTAR domain-containing protein n=1 Tax=Streptomyces flavofungini TaxID=68200 RepID=UPI0025AF6B47|nr:ANTAR domain-containing protein [Streptomyces flavofungini]WJV47197.1 ANTAR domain-containing protein [Streptomyces flavofungini]